MNCVGPQYDPSCVVGHWSRSVFSQTQPPFHSLLLPLPLPIHCNAHSCHAWHMALPNKMPMNDRNRLDHGNNKGQQLTEHELFRRNRVLGSRHWCGAAVHAQFCSIVPCWMCCDVGCWVDFVSSDVVGFWRKYKGRFELHCRDLRGDRARNCRSIVLALTFQMRLFIRSPPSVTCGWPTFQTGDHMQQPVPVASYWSTCIPVQHEHQQQRL